MSDRIKTPAVFLPLILAAAVALMARGAGNSFDGYHGFNEAWYSLIAENYAHYPWYAPTVYPGMTDLNVPPFYSYVLYGAGLVFGFKEGVFRFVSIIFSAVSIVLIFLIGGRLYGAREGAAAACLAAFCPLFVLTGRNVQTDPAYIAFMLGGLLAYLWYREKETPGRAAAAGTLFGLALFSKQFAALALPALVAMEIAEGRLRRMFNRRTLGAAVIAVAIPGVFYQYHLRHGAAALWGAMANGAIRTAGAHDAGTLLNVTHELFFGLSPLLYVVFVSGLLYALGREARKSALVIGGAAAFLVFSYLVPKHSYYAVGAVPFLALAGGRMLCAVRPKAAGTALVLLCAAAGAVSSLFILGGLKYGYSRFPGICADVAGGDPAARRVIIAPSGLLGNYDPILRYYCRGAEIISSESLVKRTGEGGEAAFDYGGEKIFILDAAGDGAAAEGSPYVRVYEKEYFGPALFGAAYAVVPAEGRSFTPGRVLRKGAPGAAPFSIVEVSREASLVLIEVPPGFRVFVRGGGLAVAPPRGGRR